VGCNGPQVGCSPLANAAGLGICDGSACLVYILSANAAGLGICEGSACLVYILSDAAARQGEGYAHVASPKDLFLTSEETDEVIEHYIEDVECMSTAGLPAHGRDRFLSFQWMHATSAGYFASEATLPPHMEWYYTRGHPRYLKDLEITALVRVEHLREDMAKMMRGVGHNPSEECLGLFDKKQARRFTGGKGQGGNIPTSTRVRELFSRRRDLLRRMCRIYIIDHVCQGYELPEECSDMLGGEV